MSCFSSIQFPRTTFAYCAALIVVKHVYMFDYSNIERVYFNVRCKCVMFPMCFFSRLTESESDVLYGIS